MPDAAVGDIQTSRFPFRFTINDSKYLPTKFHKVNPGRTKAALTGFKRILDAVDKLFEAPNHQIFSLALYYIFQSIFILNLMNSILVEVNL